MTSSLRLRLGSGVQLLALAWVAVVSSQSTTGTCDNDGLFNSSTNSCSCPSGFGGANCSQLVCSNPIASTSSRAPFNIALAGSSGSTGCAAQCTAGWSGLMCSIANGSSTCLAALTNNLGVSGQTFTTSGVYDDIVHNSGAYVWTEGYTYCDVVNPTLQAVYAGTTALVFQNSFDTADSLYAKSSVPNRGMQATLFYAAPTGNTTLIEQFYCAADTCTQQNATTNGKTTVTWQCLNLKCRCIPGTQFCGTGALDLTDTIGGLNGGIEVTCDGDGPVCDFKQSVLQTIFGAQGLELNSCQHSECTRSATIATLAAQRVNDSTTAGAGLSHGVIIGLAIVGAFIVALLGCLIWGCVVQKKARRAATALADDQQDGAVGMHWSGLSYTLPQRRFGVLGQRRRAGRVILDNLSGRVQPGTLCAILGPTGAGKSTFVELLAGKRKNGITTGSIHLVLAQGARSRKVQVGIVDQHDVLPATATVRECLHFAAELKMPETTTPSERKERVCEVLTLLGLIECADTVVGDTEHRGISGGERRRVSIGLELLATPAVLICDEPTSGLDSSAAKKVIQVLKDLTEGVTGVRTTVITTIHQPSSPMFNLFDQLILFGSSGRMMYCGDAHNASAYFATRGDPVPYAWNPADHFLELAVAPLLQLGSGDTLTSDGHDEKRNWGDNTCFIDTPTASMHSKPQACALTQFEALAKRELRNLKRDHSLVVMHVGTAAILGAFIGGMYFQVDLTIGGFQSRVGSLFFLGSLIAFSSLSALSNFANYRSLFLRERANGYYSPISWLASRIVFDLIPLRIIPILIVSSIVYWMVGLSPDAAHFFKYLLILVLYNMSTAVLNFLLAAVITDTGNAILISSILNLAQMAFAGFFIHLDSIPAAVRWIQWLCPLKYLLEALTVNEISGGLMIVDTLQGVKVSISAKVIMISLFGFNTDAYYRDVLIIAAFLIGFATILTVAVVFKLREIR
ncbi:BZ3500_MvSof-1268-A1-R1_Chr1-3g01909 [Microbotryum saponariae]|uniref:BZ3500_MvSof-1268-A1-R1_Chr1-3g01909 protein n=1 Tax=Microbotryum saponariae TaxID=289078 RepID=A0A2X0KVK2_9BASI|nr:BZ3500_MvSof-1268-A1-R1_Chr1-3g01909 [Microbotryum saponariae]SCZ94873.1 BZ3501_MvSof-1269-A2-R1_Chr1-3g01511 [Microbotryum saponariae]